ncbi:MAG: DUF3352 domain-containing protein [Bacteroidales bacterium]|nr:DUF3352 domain-containing protein [Bacteroidales bacterium]
MGKWIRIIIVLLVLSGLVAGGIYYYQNYYTKKEIIISEIYRYIPTDAALIIESKNIRNLHQRLNASCKPWLLLQNIPAFNNLNIAISFIDSVYQHHSLFKYQSQKGPVIVSFHPCGKNEVNELYIINTGSSTNIHAIKSLFQDLYKNKITFEERNYNNNSFFLVKTNSEKFYSTYSFTYLNGWLFISPSSLLIESVIRQFNSQYSLFNNPSFQKVIKTSGQHVEINVLINHKLFPRLWSDWLSPHAKKSINVKQTVAEWSALDWHVSQNMLLLNGFIDQGDSLTNYLKILTTQEPVSITATSILPKETYLFLYLSISNFTKWQEDYDKHLEAYGLYNRRQQILESVKKQTTIALLPIFKELIYKECVFVNAANPELKDTNNTDDMFWIFRTANQSTAKELLDSTLTKYIRMKNKKWNDVEIPIKLDADYTCTIYTFPVQNVPEILFGKLFRSYQTNYFTYIDNYIIFSSSKESLKRLHYANILKKTLDNDKLYRSYTEMIELQTNFLCYLDIAKSQNIVKEVLNSKLSNVFNVHFDVLRQLDAISFQLTNTNQMLYASLFIRYSPEIKENTHTVWESKLDTIAMMKPVFVLNHNTQEKEIIVQDLYNNLYLINSSGRILWKNHLPEQIRSDIYQIDMFNNKKLQYLFSTRNYLYVIDRNGEMVYPFPVKLKSPATNGVSIYDWTGKNDIRMYIACRDKNIYSYTLNGTLDKNWKPKPTNHYVYLPIQFAKFEQKEYVFYADSLNVYVANKQGKPYFIKENIAVNKKSYLYFEPKNKETESRFIVNDVYGNIHFIYTDGKQATKTFIDEKTEHYFLYNDMDGDGLNEFIFIVENNLNIFKRNYKVMLKYKLPCFSQYKPTYYEFPMAKHKIGIVCDNQLYLVDKDGNMPNGFPLKGISPFSISHLQKPVRKYFLITCNDQGYMINYEVFR